GRRRGGDGRIGRRHRFVVLLGALPGCLVRRAGCVVAVLGGVLQRLAGFLLRFTRLFRLVFGRFVAGGEAKRGSEHERIGDWFVHGLFLLVVRPSLFRDSPGGEGSDCFARGYVRGGRAAIMGGFSASPRGIDDERQ